MKTRSLWCALVVAIFFCGAHLTPAFAQDNFQISAPFTHKNLSVYLISGKDKISGKNILTLQEAMEKKLVLVYETSDVNELQIENLSKEFEIFIQSGDIVKGGKQDRVLAVDLILPALSGKVSIAAFCVESGRWTKRGGEESGNFSSSNERIVTRDLKLAANSARSQTEVWKKVEEAQNKLSSNVGATVNSAASRTSLQLSLENRKVAATTDEYVKNLSGIIDGKSNVIGYAFVINGEINSADIYASSELFKKLWAKLLRATATEAVAELVPKAKFDPISVDEIRSFIAQADKGAPTEQSVTKRMTIITRQETSVVLFEARDEKQKTAIHRSYVKKP